MIVLTKVGGSEHPAGSALIVSLFVWAATFKDSKILLYLAMVSCAHNALECVPRFIIGQQDVLFKRGAARSLRIGYGLVLIAEALQVFVLVWRAWGWRNQELAEDFAPRAEGIDDHTLGASDRIGGYRAIFIFILGILTFIGIIEGGVASHGGTEVKIIIILLLNF